MLNPVLTKNIEVNTTLRYNYLTTSLIHNQVGLESIV